MKWISTRTHLRIAIGATAALYILVILLAESLAPALQTAAIMAGGIAVIAIFPALLRTEPPA